MSQELQAMLGEEYFVTYHFNTAEVRSEVEGQAAPEASTSAVKRFHSMRQIR